MHIRFFMIGMLLCMSLFNTQAQAATLQIAMEQAAEHHPLLQMAEKQVASAKGRLKEEGSYRYNPELSLEPQRRRLNGGGTSNDYYITLSQGIEMGGKRGFREASARAGLQAATLNLERVRQQLAIEVARAYINFYFASRIFDLRKQQRDMLEQVSRAVGSKLLVGESSQLDANLAESAFVSALNAAAAAHVSLMQSRERYRIALGGSENDNFSNVILPPLQAGWKPPVDAYQVALASRPDLLLLQTQFIQSEARADLAAADRMPDITLSAMSAREAGDQLIKVGVTLALPILNSHQGAYRAALMDKERLSTGVNWSKEQLRYAVQAAVDRHASAMRAISGLVDTAIERRAGETISLARKAYDAGELDLEALVVHIQQGLNARMTALNLIQQGWLARIRLAEVLGHPEYISQGIQQ